VRRPVLGPCSSANAARGRAVWRLFRFALGRVIGKLGEPDLVVDSAGQGNAAAVHRIRHALLRRTSEARYPDGSSLILSSRRQFCDKRPMENARKWDKMGQNGTFGGRTGAKACSCHGLGPIGAFGPVRPINTSVKIGLAASEEVLTLGAGSFDPCCKMSRLAVRYLRDGEDHIRRDRGCCVE
jgi:hypothetical protein